MFMGTYRFTGNPEQLLQGYEKMMQQVPSQNMQLHVCVKDDAGITLYDTCPNREAFINFSEGQDFRTLLASSGLPAPVITQLGEVKAAFSAGQRTQ